MEKVPQATIDPEANKSREQAAKLTGTNSKYVSDAKSLREKAPDLFEKVKAGEITLPQAKVEVRRQEKREEMKAKAEAVAAAPPPARL